MSKKIQLSSSYNMFKFADGKLEEARRIWQSIVDIYPRGDAREIIDECNKLLKVTIASTDAEASIQEHE